MYTPRISTDLVEKLYQLAQELGQPMTRVVDALLRFALERPQEVGLAHGEPKQRQYRIVSYIPAVPEENSTCCLEEALKEKAQLEFIQPENRYEIEEVSMPT